MKKLIFLMLVLLASTTGYAQWRFNNNTNCAVRVKVYCFDVCVPITSYGPIPVPAIGSRPLSLCASGTPNSTVFEICWATGGCGGASSCIYIVGPGAGATCGLGPITNTLPYCPGCKPGGGLATVTVVGSNININ